MKEEKRLQNKNWEQKTHSDPQVIEILHNVLSWVHYATYSEKVVIVWKDLVCIFKPVSMLDNTQY